MYPYNSARHPNCFYLENPMLGVSLSGNTTRTHILIHVGNYIDDVQGCIAPGLRLHPDCWGVSNSRDAMNKIRGIVNADSTGIPWALKID